MAVEHIVREIPIDENFQAEVEKLHKEGWGVVPGTKPIATYHLCRMEQTQAPVGDGLGRLVVDDSKVMILRADGKIEGLTQ